MACGCGGGKNRGFRPVRGSSRATRTQARKKPNLTTVSAQATNPGTDKDKNRVRKLRQRAIKRALGHL